MQVVPPPDLPLADPPSFMPPGLLQENKKKQTTAPEINFFCEMIYLIILNKETFLFTYACKNSTPFFWLAIPIFSSCVFLLN